MYPWHVMWYSRSLGHVILHQENNLLTFTNDVLGNCEGKTKLSVRTMDRSGENTQISDFLWSFYCVLSFVPSILKHQEDSITTKQGTTKNKETVNDNKPIFEQTWRMWGRSTYTTQFLHGYRWDNLVVWKSLSSGNREQQKSSIHFTHDCVVCSADPN